MRQRLEEVGRAASMLHMDVLLLIYHFARFGTGAAAFGAHQSGTGKEVVTIEPAEA